MTSMQDKLVLVTGAGRGLGAAIAAGFAREGARLIVADLDAALAAASAQAIRDAGGRAVEATLDVTDADAVRGFAADCAARHGNIDVLVNNAGISARAAFDDPQTPEIWDRLMGVNLQGAFNVTHAFVEQLKPRAAPSSTCAPSPPMAAASRPPATWCPRAACAPSPKCWRATWRRMACGSTPSRPA